MKQWGLLRAARCASIVGGVEREVWLGEVECLTVSAGSEGARVGRALTQTVNGLLSSERSRWSCRSLYLLWAGVLTVRLIGEPHRVSTSR